MQICTDFTPRPHSRFHPTDPGDISQHCSKKAGDIILCQTATPKPGAPFTNHSEDYWSWSEFVAAHLQFFHLRFHWNYLPKAYFKDFLKSHVLSGQTWLLRAPQSRNGQDPTIQEGLLRWRLQNHRKHENRPGLQQLETQPWLLNKLFSVHPRSGSHSVAALGNICAWHRGLYCCGTTAPSPAVDHEREAVRSTRVSVHCVPASHHWHQWFAVSDRGAIC